MSGSNYGESCTLKEDIQEHHSQDEMRDVFLNMDIALKYIHDHNYCIEIFHPSKIDILGDMPDHVQFDRLMQLPKNPSERKKMIQEDIFNSALVQISIYTNIGDYLKPDFLKENFDDMTIFLPEGDVPYYRGVVQRGASVYFSEYALEKRNRDLQQLDKDLGEGVDIDPSEYMGDQFDNDRINDKIYRQISGFKEKAFIHFLLLPFVGVIGFLLFVLYTMIFS